MWHLNNNIFLDQSPSNPVLAPAPTIALGRHFVSKDKKDAFDQKFSEVQCLLEGFTTPYQIVGGWRIEKESDETEEWALFSGWEDVDHQYVLGNLGSWRHLDCIRIVEFI